MAKIELGKMRNTINFFTRIVLQSLQVTLLLLLFLVQIACTARLAGNGLHFQPCYAVVQVHVIKGFAKLVSKKSAPK